MPNQYKKKGDNPLAVAAALGTMGLMAKKAGLFGGGDVVQSDAPRGVIPGGPEAIPPKGMTGISQIDGTTAIPQPGPTLANAAKLSPQARPKNTPPPVAPVPATTPSSIPAPAAPAAVAAPLASAPLERLPFSQRGSQLGNVNLYSTPKSKTENIMANRRLIQQATEQYGNPAYGVDPFLRKADGGKVSDTCCNTEPRRSARAFPKKGG